MRGLMRKKELGERVDVSLFYGRQYFYCGGYGWLVGREGELNYWGFWYGKYFFQRMVFQDRVNCFRDMYVAYREFFLIDFMFISQGQG